jgi:hypothetical protein
LKKFYHLFLLIGIAFIYSSCTELPTGVVTNKPPDTFLSLFPDSTISPQKTKIKITWWGDDPDGFVVGYRFSFDSINWTYTTQNDSTFQLSINGNDSTFRFWVAAVDDKGLVDPTPATNRYPVFNSPPGVAFNEGTQIPETTFTVASFAWTGTDPDGDNTIRYYYWALNDTSHWHRIAGTITLLTLRQDSGLAVNSRNLFYLKAQDIAGAFSPVVKMPDSNKVWFVRQPVGHLLLINDYSTTLTDRSRAASFYESSLIGISHSILDLKIGNGANMPTIKNPMFTETLKLFQCVIWYAGRGNLASDNADFDLAQQTLPYYLAAGGKVFFTSGFPNSIPEYVNYVDFAPIDSITNYAVPITNPGVQTIVLDNNYPFLETDSVYTPDRVRGIYNRQGTDAIYKLPYNPPYDTTKLTICMKDLFSNPKVMVMSVPLHRMNNTGSAVTFLQRVISIDFGISR